jgi:hypothetical protein
MPEGPKGEKRPADVIGNAVAVAEIAAGEIEEEFGPEGPKPGKDAAAADLGERAGAAQAKKDRQEGRGLALEQARMSDRQTPWWDAVGTGESVTLKVERGAKPPLPWTWEIVSEGGKAGAQRSSRGYRSAEEAWAAGRTPLADLGRRGGPGR